MELIEQIIYLGRIKSAMDDAEQTEPEQVRLPTDARAPTDAEYEISLLKPEERRVMAELVLAGYKFVPMRGGIFKAYTPAGNDVYSYQVEGMHLTAILRTTKAHATGMKE